MNFYFIIYLLLLMIGIAWGYINRRSISFAFLALSQLLAWIFTLEIIGLYIQQRTTTNFPVYHIIHFVEIVYFGLIFSSLLRSKSFLWLTMVILSFSFSVTSIYLSIYYHGLNSFPSINNLLLSLYAVFGGLVLFLKMMQHPTPNPILKQSVFWFAAGVLFFHSITFFFFGYYNILARNATQFPSWGYTLIKASNYILYSCYFLAIFFDSRGKANTIDG